MKKLDLKKLIQEVIKENSSPEAVELQLYIENDADLYRQQYIPILQNLSKKKKKGVYNPQLAPKLFRYLVDNGAKKYAKEFGTGVQDAAKMFPGPVRDVVALELTRAFESDFENKEYDFMKESSLNESLKDMVLNLFKSKNPKKKGWWEWDNFTWVYTYPNSEGLRVWVSIWNPNDRLPLDFSKTKPAHINSSAVKYYVIYQDDRDPLNGGRPKSLDHFISSDVELQNLLKKMNAEPIPQQALDSMRTRLTKDPEYQDRKIDESMKKLDLKKLIKEIIKEVKSLKTLNEAWVGFDPAFPVTVVGVDETNNITSNGHGWKKFPNFAAAKAVFPDLDPNNSSKRFTWAMNGGDNTTRFETWEAEKMYST